MAHFRVLDRDGKPLFGARVQVFNAKLQMVKDIATGHGGKTAAQILPSEFFMPTESQPAKCQHIPPKTVVMWNARSIREWRHGLGLTQRAFGRMVGIRPNYVSHLERGFARVGIRTQRKLEKAYKKMGDKAS